MSCFNRERVGGEHAGGGRWRGAEGAAHRHRQEGSQAVDGRGT